MVVIEKEGMPKLRFPEYKDVLHRKQLGDNDVATFSKGKGISKADINDDGKTPCVRYGELYTHYGDVIDTVYSSTNIDSSELLLSKGNEVIVPASGETPIDIATSAVVKNAGIALGGDLNIISFNGDGHFLASYLGSKKRIELARLSQGNSVVHLYSAQLRSLYLHIPSIKEQQKIAAFLSSVDDKLNKLRRKHELLETWKRGLMQKIFSQQLRFKQDDDTPFLDWKEQELMDVLKPNFRETNKPKENYLAIGVRSHMKGTFQKPNSDPDANSMEKLFVVKEGDLVVNITFAWEGAIAIVKPDDNGAFVSHRFPTYEFKEDRLIAKYFQYVICQKRFKHILYFISPGGAGRNRVLNKRDFLKIKWNLPMIDEQQKIAEFFASVDKKIEAVSQQITQTETFKKGLLQKMFV